jgi:hypothetical protein
MNDKKEKALHSIQIWTKTHNLIRELRLRFKNEKNHTQIVDEALNQYNKTTDACAEKK